MLKYKYGCGNSLDHDWKRNRRDIMIRFRFCGKLLSLQKWYLGIIQNKNNLNIRLLSSSIGKLCET